MARYPLDGQIDQLPVAERGLPGVSVGTIIADFGFAESDPAVESLGVTLGFPQCADFIYTASVEQSEIPTFRRTSPLDTPDRIR